MFFGRGIGRKLKTYGWYLTMTLQKGINKNSIIGDWSGTLDIGIAQINIVLHLKVDSNESFNGTFDYLEEKMYGLEIDSLIFQDKSLKFEIKKFLVNFEGVLINNNLQISGQWSQYGKLFPIIFEKGKKSIETPKRPQEPKLPYPYKEEMISFESQNATLSGTLTSPFSKAPFPAVILISGAGPSDRDGSILGHKPFWILADYLTCQGIAVLRFDKRGCGKSTGDFNNATTEDFASDVFAGVEHLRSRKDIDSKQIGLIGHSEGGIIAPMVALKSHDIAYIVLMAACGVNGEEMMCAWSESIEKDKGSTEESIERDRKYKKELFAILKSEKNFDAAAKQLRKIILNHTISKEKKDELSSFESEAIDAEVNYLNTHWFRYFLAYEPALALRKIQIPVLALNGELDKQIFSKQNLPVISHALKEAGNENYKVVELPKLNHIFQTCQDGSFTEYSKIEETISPIALHLIADWILKSTIK